MVVRAHRGQLVMSFLTVDNVSKRFDGVVAVDQASFAIDRGEVVGFLGPNGAGKTTTMRMITQYLEPDEGSIRFDDIPLADAGESAKRRIGYLAENNPLYHEMLVTEYLEFIARLRGIDGAERGRAIDEAVHAAALESVFYRPIAELSKGFRQRVGLAAAILHRPDLLVLDEPTEGLDPNQRVEIRRLIADLGRDRTVLLSTHVLSEVETMCGRLLIVNRGRLAADGPVSELVTRARGAARITVEARGDGVAAAMRDLPGVASLEESRGDGDRIRVNVLADGSRDLRQELFRLAVSRGWTLFELHEEAGSLEDLFRQITSAET